MSHLRQRVVAAPELPDLQCRPPLLRPYLFVNIQAVTSGLNVGGIWV